MNIKTVFEIQCFLKYARIFSCVAILVFGGIFFCQNWIQAQEHTRDLAPGVMKTIKPDVQILETRDDYVDPIDLASKVIDNDLEIFATLGTRDVFEVTATGDEYDWAKEFPQDAKRFLYDDNAKEKLHNKYEKNTSITCLEFQFKIPRIIVVDLPKDGKIIKTPVLYLIYNVTNKKWSKKMLDQLKTLQQNSDPPAFHVTSEQIEKMKQVHLGKISRGDLPDLGVDFGSSIKTKEISPAVFEMIPDEAEFSFIPQFVLATNQLEFSKKNNYTTQYYKLDQIIPLAIPKIIEQEDPNREFETTVTMTDKKITSGETVWGIAMWSGIPPEIKNFSILISGLSNAYKWTHDEPSQQQGVVGTGYTMTRKTLKLNFWMPGDAAHFLQREIQLDTKAPVDHEWIYR
ncbi:MAG: hypothetical protein LBJ67_19075 [Planctomycetaceae bacterium]|jgi:hypothetical protein|nr:hypothetical protein [Planctomycetaceae bacterium]